MIDPVFTGAVQTTSLSTEYKLQGDLLFFWQAAIARDGGSSPSSAQLHAPDADTAKARGND
jgi:hypothetical protein